MKGFRRLPQLGVLLGLMSLASRADVILPPGSLWEYSTDLGASWNAASPAPFGNYISSGPGDNWDPPGDFNYRTLWPELGNMWVRTTIDLTTSDLNSIYYALGVDNGYDLFVNGHLVSSGYAELYTYRWEYAGQMPAEDLVAGQNQLMVKLADNGVLTAFDMEVAGEPISGGTIPEPESVPDAGGTLTLAAVALACLSRVRRE